MPNPTTIEKLPLSEGVRIIASNKDGLVALDKPDGVRSHPNSAEDTIPSILDASYDYDEEVFIWEDSAGVEYRAWLINRLDSPTSGVILLSLNPELSTTIKQQFATHKVSKTYYALVRYVPKVLAGAWNDNLKKDVYRGNRLFKNDRIVSAKARYQVVKSPPGGFPICLIKLMPLTGRTHQLRVQCKKHGHPIVGDGTYGSFSFNREVANKTQMKRMMLHSAETIVNYTFHGKVRVFKASSELPEAFAEVLRYRPGLSHSHKPPLDSASPVKRETPPSLAGRRFRH
jgi:23S rRNA-/tRNA-specific pseudouridylate synthase